MLTDGTKRRRVQDVWQADADHRGEIGRALVLACLDRDVSGVSIYASLVFGPAVPVFFPATLNPAALQTFLVSFPANYLILPSASSAIPAGYSPAFAWGGYQVFAADRPHQHDLLPGLAMLATTSGSTGSAKVIRQSAKNIVVNTQQIITALGLNDKTIAATTLPIFYTFGMSTVNCQIFTGGTLVCSALSVTQKAFLDLLVSQHVTLFSGVPQTYEQLAGMRFFKSRYASTVEKFLQAGGKMSSALETAMRKTCAASGQQFYVMYGQAEATTRMSILPAEDFLTCPGSAGLALPGGTFSIVDEHGKPLAHGREGEILYHGPNVTLGYAQNAAELALPDRFNGVLRTGDLGILDKRGNITITGRLKRFAKVNGHSINLAHLESLIEASLGAPVVCFESANQVHIATTQMIDVMALEEVLSTRTDLKPRETRLHYIDDLPALASGKIDYAALKTQLAA